MSLNSHLNLVPDDTYCWTPQALCSAYTANQAINSFSDIPPATTWKKILCQPAINTDQNGRILRRLLSIISTDLHSFA